MNMSNPMYHAICATLNFISEPLYQFLQTVDHTETIFICPNSEIWHEPSVHIFDEQNTDRSTILLTTSDGKIKNVEVNPSPEKVEAFNEHTKIAEEEPPPGLARDSESENAESESENAESESENADSESENESESESKSDKELKSKPRSEAAPPAPTNDDEDELLEAAVVAPVRKTRKSTSSKAGSEAKAPAKPSASKKHKRKSDNASDEKGTNENSEVRVAKKRKTRDAATKANAKILSKSSKGSKSNGATSKVAVAASESAAAAKKKSTIAMKEAKSNEVGEGKTKNKRKKKDPSKPKPIDNTKKGSKGNESSTSKVAASASSAKMKKTTEAKLNEAEGGVKKKKAVSKPKNKVGEVADASNSKTKAVKKAAGKDVAEPEAPQKVGDKVGGRKRSQSVATADSAASGSTTKKAKSTNRKKKNEDPNMPKRPLTVYMLYCMEARPAAKKANPTAKVPEIGSILGKSWKELPEKDKMRLQAKAQKLKDQYDLDKADYEKKNPPKDDNGDGDNDNDGDTPVSEGNADATENNSTGNASSAKKKKKKKQQKDPNAPKRPLTSYMIYSNDVRHDVMKKNPGAKVPEVGKITGQMYGKLSKERRQHYAQRAQVLKDKYDIDKAEYAKKQKIADDDASKDPQDESEWF